MSLRRVPASSCLAGSAASGAVAMVSFMAGATALSAVALAVALACLVAFAARLKVSLRNQAAFAAILIGFGIAAIFSVPQLGFLAIGYGLLQLSIWVWQVTGSHRPAQFWAAGMHLFLVVLALIVLHEAFHLRVAAALADILLLASLACVPPWAYCVARRHILNESRSGAVPGEGPVRPNLA